MGHEKETIETNQKMNGNSALIELLNRCIVLIDTDDQIGTGFFVAPGKILTCAHVIENAVAAGHVIRVIYAGVKYEVRVLRPEEVFSDDSQDLALLHIKLKAHPCVLLSADNFSVTSNLHSYGFSISPDTQKIVGEEIKTILEGRRDELRPDLTLEQIYIKFKDGQIKPGNSGAPLLDMDAWAVTGVVNRTRGKESDLGGFAIPMKTVFALYPGLRKLNEKYHKADPAWMRLAQGIKARKPSNPISAELITEPGKTAQAENFVERDVILNQVEKLLEKETARVNMNGMPGIGKTTLAREVVDRWLGAKRGAVLWVDVGSAAPEEVIEAIAEDAYKNQKLLGDAHDFGSKREILHKFLEEELKSEKLGLVVLDNIVEGNTWYELSNAFPKKLPTLITSRTRFAAKDFVDVGQLSPEQALYMLGKTVGDEEDYSRDKDAAFLCELFGYHPLALEILGANMKEARLNPKKQHERLEKDPTRLESEVHEDRLWVLLESSAAKLNDIERSVFESFGEFPVNGLTINLLTIYLRKPSEDVLEALDHLGKRNLVKNRPDTDFYYLHDLIFHYVKSLTRPIERNKSSLIRTTLDYLKKFRHDFNLIKLDIGNLLAISRLSNQLNLVKIISYLTIGNFPLQEGKSYADQRRYSIGLIEQLDKAINIARAMGDELKSTTHYLLGKRGNAAFDKGEYQLAAKMYLDELLLSPDDNRRARVRSIYARSLVYCDRVDEARSNFEEAKQLANKLGDDTLRSYILEQEGAAALFLKDFEYVCQVTKSQLEIARSLYDETPSMESCEGYFDALLNLGVAELELAKQGRGDFRQASKIHEEALGLAEKHKSEVLIAYALTNLGEEYHYLGEKERAASTFQQAFLLWNSLNMSENQKYVEELARELNYPSLELEEHNEQED